MRNDTYIGLFRALPEGNWRARFPDLSGCEARGKNFKEVFEAARKALTDHPDALDEPQPRPRSSAELLIDAQRDRLLCREFVDAVITAIRIGDRRQLQVPATSFPEQAAASSKTDVSVFVSAAHVPLCALKCSRCAAP